MNPFKISVIIQKTYKKPRLLVRCLEALSKQDFPLTEFEILVVSDGYDTETVEIRSRFNPRSLPAVKYHNLQKKAGPAAVKNRGWQHALGELIVFTTDDCIPHKNWLTSYWNAFESNNLKAAAFCGLTKLAYSKSKSPHILIPEHQEMKSTNCACTKKALLSIGGFDERFTLPFSEDHDFEFKLLEKNIPVVNVDANVIRAGKKMSIRSSIKQEKNGLFNALLYKKYPELYKKTVKAGTPWIHYFHFSFVVLVLIGLLFNIQYLWMGGSAGWLLTSILYTIVTLSSKKVSSKQLPKVFMASLIVPFISMYYRIYGSLRYGVPLLP